MLSHSDTCNMGRALQGLLPLSDIVHYSVACIFVKRHFLSWFSLQDTLVLVVCVERLQQDASFCLIFCHASVIFPWAKCCHTLIPEVSTRIAWQG